MSADVWFKQDVVNALLAASQAGHMAASMGNNPEFLKGYRMAIENLALSFGVSSELVLPPASPNVRQIGNSGNGW